MDIKKILALLTALILLSACTGQVGYLRDAGSDVASVAPVKTGKKIYVFRGLLPFKQEIDAVAICGSEENISKVRTSKKLLDNALAFITVTLISPASYEVYCVNGDVS